MIRNVRWQSAWISGWGSNGSDNIAPAATQ